MIALVDCRNFYASCERVFRPDLAKTPIVILSSNDGCIIARSDEAKALGVPMGEPYFKAAHIIKEFKIVVFSANFSLYGNMSNRVMAVLGEFSDKLEIYSIDEAFLDCSQEKDLKEYGRLIHYTVRKWTNIPVAVGIAPTKTLAKIGCLLTKRDPDLCGVGLVTANMDLTKILSEVSVSDIWGIGRKLSKSLKLNGINNAQELRMADLRWIQKRYGINVVRTIYELHGTACSELRQLRPIRKSICSSRSFGRKITELREIEEAVAAYVSRAAEKLRSEELKTTTIGVYIRGGRFTNSPFSQSYFVNLFNPTDDTSFLIKIAQTAIRKIFKAGIRYEKCGVSFFNLSLKSQHQLPLFSSINQDLMEGKQLNLGTIIDKLNQRYGRDTLFISACGITPSWKTKAIKMSPHYTTDWRQLPTIG